jgi:hypothetical protein
MLSEARDNITLYTTKWQKEREKVKQQLKNVKEKQANVYKLKGFLRKQVFPAASKEELERANEDLVYARAKKKTRREAQGIQCG